MNIWFWQGSIEQEHRLIRSQWTSVAPSDTDLEERPGIGVIEGFKQTQPLATSCPLTVASHGQEATNSSPSVTTLPNIRLPARRSRLLHLLFIQPSFHKDPLDFLQDRLIFRYTF